MLKQSFEITAATAKESGVMHTTTSVICQFRLTINTSVPIIVTTPVKSC